MLLIALILTHTALWHYDEAALKKWAKVDHKHPDGQSRDPQDLWHFKWNEPVHGFPSACALVPQQIYGPFWKDEQPRRQDIRAGQRGIYMRLALQVIDVNTCMPVHSAKVDTWHLSLNRAAAKLYSTDFY